MEICVVNHMSLTEWTLTYGIHHFMILGSSNRKLASVRFWFTITELRLDVLTDWAIRSAIRSVL